MRKFYLIICLFAIDLVSGLPGTGFLLAEKENVVNSVENLDLNKYKGLWYEVARIPNRFQRECDCCTTAEYRLREDGKIDVINRCVNKDGETVEAKGIAKVADARNRARLKVSFVRFLGLSLFWGDYWVLGLGPDYSYAVVGTPNRKYGWILSRKPELDPVLMREAEDILRRNGYDPDEFIVSAQKKTG